MTNNFRGGSAAPRTMLFRRRRRCYIGIEVRAGLARLLDPPKLRNAGLEPYVAHRPEPVFLCLRSGFPRNKPRDQADSGAAQMRK